MQQHDVMNFMTACVCDHLKRISFRVKIPWNNELTNKSCEKENNSLNVVIPKQIIAVRKYCNRMCYKRLIEREKKIWRKILRKLFDEWTCVEFACPNNCHMMIRHTLKCLTSIESRCEKQRHEGKVLGNKSSNCLQTRQKQSTIFTGKIVRIKTLRWTFSNIRFIMREVSSRQKHWWIGKKNT